MNDRSRSVSPTTPPRQAVCWVCGRGKDEGVRLVPENPALLLPGLYKGRTAEWVCEEHQAPSERESRTADVTFTVSPDDAIAEVIYALREGNEMPVIARAPSRSAQFGRDSWEIILGNDGVAYCSCMAWKFSRGRKDCKHLAALRYIFGGGSGGNPKVQEAVGEVVESLVFTRRIRVLDDE